MTTQQAQHTPRPLTLRRAPYIGKAAYYLDPPDGPAVAVVFTDGLLVSEAKERAEFILAACNSHDDLLAALAALRRRHDAKAVAANFASCGCEDCNEARTALAQATGGQP